MTDSAILPGAEPFYFAGNEVGVLLSHGFTGSPQSMRWLGEQVHAAGYTVAGVRLAGHGTSPADMAHTNAQDWIASVDEALDTLQQTCSQVFMVGLSMGGTLTLYSAAKRPELICGAVTVNAAVRVGGPVMSGLVYDRHAPATVPGIGCDIKAAWVQELAYDEVPVGCFREAMNLATVAHELLPVVRCPVLVITSREDHVVDPSNGPLIVQRLGSNRIDLRWLDNSYHVATLDNDRAAIAAETITFIRSVAGT